MHCNLVGAIAPFALLGAVTPALAQGPYTLTVIHVNTPGHPTNVVPGVPGVAWRPGNVTTAFGRPITSSDGLHFAFAGETDEVATLNDVLILDGALVMKEGSPTPWAGGIDNVGTIDEEFGLNAMGDLLIGNNTSAATNDDDVALFQGGSWTVVAKEAGLVNLVVPGLVGDGGLLATWDDSNDSCRLSNLGLPMFRGVGIDALSTGVTNDAVIVLGGGVAWQKGVTVPTNQALGATNAWESFDLEDLNVSPDGTMVLVQGDLLGATASDDVLVLNGVVVIQEGSVLPGSGFSLPVNTNGLGIVKAWIDRGGNWYARGNNSDAVDWLVRSGVLVADSSGTAEVVSGSGEHWDDATSAACFFAADGNAAGNFVIGGTTDNVDSLANEVIVFDDGLGARYVVVREGDPVDLDGNGLFDDNRFYDEFGTDDVLLLNDGSIIFTATLRDLSGTAVDQGLFQLVPRTATCTFRNGTGINPIACTCVTLPVVGTTWQLAVSSGPNTIGTLLLADVLAIPPFPIFGGELLIAPAPFLVPTSIPVAYGWLGSQFSLQGIRLDLVGGNLAVVLTNAQDVVIGH